MAECTRRQPNANTMGFIDKVLKGFLGDKNTTDLKEVKEVVAKIKAVEPKIQELTDDGLRDKPAVFKEKIIRAAGGSASQSDQINEQI